LRRPRAEPIPTVYEELPVIVLEDYVWNTYPASDESSNWIVVFQTNHPMRLVNRTGGEEEQYYYFADRHGATDRALGTLYNITQLYDGFYHATLYLEDHEDDRCPTCGQRGYYGH
jgi:hypothetical protein